MKSSMNAFVKKGDLSYHNVSDDHFPDKDDHFKQTVLDLEEKGNQQDLLHFFLSGTYVIARECVRDLHEYADELTKNQSIKNQQIKAHNELCLHTFEAVLYGLDHTSQHLFPNSPFMTNSEEGLISSIGWEKLTFMKYEYPPQILYAVISILISQTWYAQQLLLGNALTDRSWIDGQKWVFLPPVKDHPQQKSWKYIDQKLYKSLRLSLDLGVSHLRRYKQEIHQTYFTFPSIPHS